MDPLLRRQDILWPYFGIWTVDSRPMTFAESTKRSEGGVEEEKESLLDTCPDKQYLVLSILTGLKSVPNFASQSSTFVDASTYFCSPKQSRTPEGHAYPAEPILSQQALRMYGTDFNEMVRFMLRQIGITWQLDNSPNALWFRMAVLYARAGSEDVTPLSALRDQLGLKPHEKYHVEGKINFNHFIGACEYIRAPTLVQALKSRAAILRPTQVEYFEFVIPVFLGKSDDEEITVDNVAAVYVRVRGRGYALPCDNVVENVKLTAEECGTPYEIWVVQRVQEKKDEDYGGATHFSRILGVLPRNAADRNAFEKLQDLQPCASLPDFVLTSEGEKLRPGKHF